MGLLDFFKRRHEKEEASPQRSGSVEVEGSASGAGDASSVDEMVRGLKQQFGDENVAVDVEQGPGQTVDLRGTGAREEFVELLRKHGVDPASGEQIDASTVPGLEEEIMELLERRGVDLPGGDSPGDGAKS